MKQSRPLTFVDYLRHKAITVCTEAAICFRGKRFFRELEENAQDTARAQTEALRNILAEYEATEYGQFHQINGRTGPEEFRQRVPINEYETLAPWIKRQMEEPHSILTKHQPVHYGVTSGTTGEPKYVPVLRDSLSWNRRAILYAAYDVLRQRPKAFSGRILGITGAACESFTPRGVPIGSKSGEAYENIPRLIKPKYVMPNAALAVKDSRLKFQLILRLALNHDDLTYIQTANTSTLVLLGEILNEEWDSFVYDLENGGFSGWDHLTPTIQKAIQPLLAPRRGRALQLKGIAQRKKIQAVAADEPARIRISDVFPKVQAVGCWLSGSCGIFYNRVREEFSPETLIRDIGYIATETIGTVPHLGDTTSGIPVLQHVFYEFIPRDAWEQGKRETLLLHELSQGEQYYVLITTSDGLLRYNMNDIVEVAGSFYSAPKLRFVQKGRGMTNITGEKLSEYQVLEAVHRVEKARGFASTFFFMAADEARCCYRLFYEPFARCRREIENDIQLLAEAFDRELAGMNLEYSAKRASSRLKPLQLSILNENTVERVRQVWQQLGRRDAQFKLIHLQYLRELEFDFIGHSAVHSAVHSDSNNVVFLDAAVANKR